MKHYMWAIFLLSFASSAASQQKSYTLDTAPWVNQSYEVCQTSNDKGLRAVIFEPEIEEWTYPESDLPTTKLVAYPGGIKEVDVKNERNLPAYYLKEQRVGYLDTDNIWVTENGIQATSLKHLHTTTGEKIRPRATVLYEKFVYKANWNLEHSLAMEKIHHEPPCTAFSLGHYDKLEVETNYDFGQNNPYQCDAEKGLKRSQEFNYTIKSHRPIVTMPDSSSYYIKYPDGRIKAYGWTGFERLYNKDGSLICDWKDIGSLIGYELTQASE